MQSNFALVLGAYHIPLTNEYIGYVFIRYQNVRAKIGTFCGDSFHYKPLEFKKIDGKMYSIHNIVSAYNKHWKIDIEYKAQVSDDNPGGRGLGLKVFEQVSKYTVTLQKSSDDGKTWNVVEEKMQGFGFSEWSHSTL